MVAGGIARVHDAPLRQVDVAVRIRGDHHGQEVTAGSGRGGGAYCHNDPGIIPDGGLFHPQFDQLRTLSPAFGERDAEILARYLRVRVGRGDGQPVVDAYDQRGIGPSKGLIEHAGEMIRRQDVSRLLDEQMAANNAIMGALRSAARLKMKRVPELRFFPDGTLEEGNHLETLLTEIEKERAARPVEPEPAADPTES